MESTSSFPPSWPLLSFKRTRQAMKLPGLGAIGSEMAASFREEKLALRENGPYRDDMNQKCEVSAFTTSRVDHKWATHRVFEQTPIGPITPEHLVYVEVKIR